MSNSTVSSLQRNEDIGCCYRSISATGLRVVWEITSSCHLTCKHCFRTLPSLPELSPQEALQLIEQMPAVDVQKVTLTGGEPFLRSDLLDIMTALRHRLILTKVLTSLTVLSQRVLDRLGSLGAIELGFSIDGPDAETHDWIRGDGQFALLRNNLVRVARLGNVQLNGICVLSRRNVTKIAEVSAFASQQSLRSITFSALLAVEAPEIRVPRGFYDTQQLSADEKRDALTAIRRARGRHPEMAVRSVGLAGERAPCCAGIDLIHVDPGANVNPCTLYRSRPTPNLRHHSLKECLQSIRSSLPNSGVSHCDYHKHV